jgi:hypothetical protein
MNISADRPARARGPEDLRPADRHEGVSDHPRGGAGVLKDNPRLARRYAALRTMRAPALVLRDARPRAMPNNPGMAPARAGSSA